MRQRERCGVNDKQLRLDYKEYTMQIRRAPDSHFPSVTTQCSRWSSDSSVTEITIHEPPHWPYRAPVTEATADTHRKVFYQ